MSTRRVAGALLVLAGLVVAGFGAWQLWGTGIATARFQHHALSVLDQTLPTTAARADAPPLVAPGASTTPSPRPSAANTPAPVATAAPAVHTAPKPIAFMEIVIPSMHVRAAVVEGVANADIAMGPGHVPGTALPGQGRNIAIAAHRATHGAEFRYIESIHIGDLIYLHTKNGVYTYKVIPQHGRAWRLVQPADTYVLDPGNREILTLISCHPAWASTNRVIVLAVPVPTPANAA